MVALVAGFFIFETIGYLLHWVMHQRWSGLMWRSHMKHHRMYPPREAVAEGEYRTIGADSAVFVYITVGAVLAALFVATLSLRMALPLAAEMLLVGWLNDAVHDATHVRGHWLQRFAWFERIRETHVIHHRNMKYNHGLLTFVADRAMKTYQGPG